MQRINSNEEARKWSDHIPLEWKYTAGVAGDRFLQLLKQGKLQACVCKGCNKLFIPPKIFCKDCFVQLKDWIEVPEDSGYVYSFTTLKNSQGQEETIALVKFNGIDGGLVGRLKRRREEPRIGMKVRPVFKQKEQRKGELADIEYFEKSNL